MIKLSEHEIQCQVVDLLRIKKILVIQTDVMSALQFFSHKDKRRFAFINHSKKMGYVPGTNDLIILLDKPYFIEMKTQKGYQSETQKKFQKDIEDLGYTYLLWRSCDDCLEWLKNL